MDCSGPEDAVQTGEGWLSVLPPQLGEGTHRYEATVIFGVADAAEVVFPSETSGVCLMDQATQKACLESGDILLIQGSKLTAGPVAEESVRQAAEGARVCQPLL
jgi:hypothetical protein